MKYCDGENLYVYDIMYGTKVEYQFLHEVTSFSNPLTYTHCNTWCSPVDVFLVDFDGQRVSAGLEVSEGVAL